MSGLDFLFSPTSQAYNAGQQMTLDRLNNQRLDLGNQTTAAALPGVMGQSQSLAAQGTLDQAAVPDKLQLQHQMALEKMDDSQLKELSNYGEKMGQLGAALENVPPLLRPQAMQSMSAKFGIQANIPGLDQVPPDQLPQALTKIGQGMALSSNKFIQERQLKQMGEDQALARQKLANQGAVEAAGVRANASSLNAQTAAEAKLEAERIKLQGVLSTAAARIKASESRADLATQAAALATSPDFSTNPVKQEQYRKIMKTATLIKQAGVQTMQSDVMAGRDPNTPAQNIDAGIEDVISTPQTAAPAPVDAKTVQDAFGSYDPQKYDYAVVNGKVYRKPKK